MAHGVGVVVNRRVILDEDPQRELRLGATRRRDEARGEQRERDELRREQLREPAHEAVAIRRDLREREHADAEQQEVGVKQTRDREREPGRERAPADVRGEREHPPSDATSEGCRYPLHRYDPASERSPSIVSHAAISANTANAPRSVAPVTTTNTPVTSAVISSACAIAVLTAPLSSA